ncbi:MAG: hypothetical protein MK085_12890, partial [Phycisphaerales bacterium]|nr:hypothetical protein [Phycisphaerales bacterium]
MKKLQACILFGMLATSAFAEPPRFGVFDAQVGGVDVAREIGFDADGQVVVQGEGLANADQLFEIDPLGRIATAARDADGPYVIFHDADGREFGRLRCGDEPAAIDLAEDGFAMLDSDGTLIVSDLVMEDSPSGPRMQAVPRFTRERAFPGARGVAMDSSGGAWVADTDRHRLVHLDADGEEQLAFGGRGAFPGLFNTPMGIDLHEGQVFVADKLNHRVVVHDAKSGDFLYQWGMHAVVPREGEGKIHYPEAVDVAPDGSSVVVLEPFERRYQRFVAMPEGEDPSGRLPKKLAVESHFGPQLGTDGDLLVMQEPESAAATVFDLRRGIPIHVTTMGRSGTGASQFGRIASIAVDGERQETWFLDAGNRRIAAWRLDRDAEGRLRHDPFMGRFVRSIEFDALAERVRQAGGGSAFEPARLIFDDDGLWILGRDGQRLVSIGRDFTVRSVNRLQVPEVPDFRATWCVRDEQGGVLALSESGDSVWRFDASNSPQAIWSAAEGQEVRRPVSMALVDGGRLVLSDRVGDRLHVVGGGGESGRQEIAELGSWDGALWLPGEVHPFPGGMVVVVVVIVAAAAAAAVVVVILVVCCGCCCCCCCCCCCWCWCCCCCCCCCC